MVSSTPSRRLRNHEKFIEFIIFIICYIQLQPHYYKVADDVSVPSSLDIYFSDVIAQELSQNRYTDVSSGCVHKLNEKLKQFSSRQNKGEATSIYI